MTDYQKAILTITNMYRAESNSLGRLIKKADEFREKLKNKSIPHGEYTNTELALRLLEDTIRTKRIKSDAYHDAREALMNIEGSMKNWVDYQRDENGLAIVPCEN